MNLKIDDEYCEAVGRYCKEQAERTNSYIERYISILMGVRRDAIKSGKVADALDSYVSYAKKMRSQLINISVTIQKQIRNYISDVDAADDYLF